MFNSTQSSDSFSWSVLPFVPLVSIFQYLDYEDRFNASLVCHDWSIAFDCPTLWKDMSLIFTGDMLDDSRKALLFAKKHSTSTKNLTIRFPVNNETRSKEVLNNVQLLLEYLFSSRLFSFEIENVPKPFRSYLTFAHSITQVQKAFKNFIGAQKILRILVFYNMSFTENYGLDILEEVNKRNEILQELGLIHFFEGNVGAYNNQAFQNVMKNFSNLRVLRLSYQCISVEIIEVLSQSENTELQQLSVLCSFKEDLHHRIPNQSWNTLRRKFPALLISFEIVEIVTQPLFENLVQPATQVNIFKYKCGFTLQTEQNLHRHGVAIIRYITHNFSYSLRYIRLDFGFVGIPSLERAILSLLRNCKMLRKLVLSGVLRSEVATRVCEIAMQQESELKDIFLMFFFTSIESLDAMIRLQDYKQQLKEKGVNFEFNLLIS